MVDAAPSYRASPLKIDPRPITIHEDRGPRGITWSVEMVDVRRGWKYRGKRCDSLIDAVRLMRDELSLPIVAVLIVQDGEQLMAINAEETPCHGCRGTGKFPLFTSVEPCGDCGGRGTQLQLPDELPPTAHAL